MKLRYCNEVTGLFIELGDVVLSYRGTHVLNSMLDMNMQANHIFMIKGWACCVSDMAAVRVKLDNNHDTVELCQNSFHYTFSKQVVGIQFENKTEI